MQITASQIKDIKTSFAGLKPQKVTLDGNRNMTVKEAIFALAPTLERMKKRGFDMEELVTKLHEKGVPVKAPTLAKGVLSCLCRIFAGCLLISIIAMLRFLSVINRS